MIRSILYPELDRCAEVIREGFLTVAREFGLTEQNCPSNGAFMQTERLQRDFVGGNLMYGYCAEEAIVGFAEMSKKPEGLFTIEKLSVLPKHRHNGYGRTLIDFCRQTAKASNGVKLSIGIIEENARLKAWYQTLGFVSTGTRKFEHLPFTVGFMGLFL